MREDRLSGLYGGDQRTGPEDLHDPLQIVGEDLEADLGFHVLQPLHQEVGRAHPGFDRSEGVVITSWATIR